MNLRPWFGPLPSLLLALGCGGASIEVLPAPLGAESYALSAERQWICAESADRDQRKLWGLGITTAGSLAALVGAAWLADQGARGDRIEAGWVATTVAGEATPSVERRQPREHPSHRRLRLPSGWQRAS